MIRLLRPTAIATTIVSLSACAVLRIDVDVYKGPLANHEEVQIQELTTMAIGAKPLLIELRDRIEWGENGELFIIPSHETGYRYDYMEVCPGGPLKKYQAVRVNEVLGLYKNRTDLVNCDMEDQRAEDQRAEDQRVLILVKRFNQLSAKYKEDKSKVRLKTLFEKYDTDPNDEYVRLRNLLMRMWRTSVDILRESVATYGNKRPSLLRDVAELIAKLTHPRSLAIAMYAPRAPSSVRDTLRRRLENKAPGGGEFWREKKWNAERYGKADLFLAQVLIEYPKATLDQLQEAHDWVRGRTSGSEFMGIGAHPAAAEKLAHQARRRFGIVRGPSYQDEAPGTSAQDTPTQETPRKVVRGSGMIADLVRGMGEDIYSQFVTGGLGGGRLDDGLEKLIDLYLTSKWGKDLDKSSPIRMEVHRTEVKPDDADKHKKVLILALIRFAAKVLKIANNEELLSSSLNLDDSIKTYVLVLQAIGNSILVQADELIRMDTHRKEGRDLTALKSELEGIKVALGPKGLGGVDLEDLTDLAKCKTSACLEAPQSRGRTIDKRKVLDRLIAALRYELIAATRAQGVDSGPTNMNEKVPDASGRTGAGANENADGATPSSRPSVEVRRLTDGGNAAPAADDAGGDQSANGEAGADTKGQPVQAADLPKSARVRYLERALAIALEHRSGMVYIRPPSAYLRTSYAATGLQSDPRLAWENMLWAHMKRSMPFISEMLVNSSDLKRLETLKEIDKQFWQNINSVRLAGAGITNYALVKDDIGNWYAKGFSADPEPIIRGAQSLALYSLGGKLNMNLLRQRNLEAKRDKNNGQLSSQESTELNGLQERNRAEAATGGPDKAFRAIFDGAQRKYFIRTTADFDFFKARAKDVLPNTIRDGWRAALPDDGTVPDRAKALALVQNAAGDPIPLTKADGLLVEPEMACDLDKLAENRVSCLARAKGQSESIGRALEALIEKQATLLRDLEALNLASDAVTKHNAAKKALADKQAAIAAAETKVKVLQAKLDLATAKRDSLLLGNPVAPQKAEYEKAVTDAVAARDQAQQDRATVATGLGDLFKTESNTGKVLAQVQGKIATLKGVVVSAIQGTLKVMFDRRRDAAEDFRETIQVVGEAAS